MRRIKIQTTDNNYIKLFDRREIIELCKKVLDNENVKKYNASIIFVNEKFIIDLNRRFFNLDETTDVISFSLSENMIEGEVYVNMDIIKQQAEYYKVGFEDELSRVIIHAVLHLAGYLDGNEEEKKIMREKEDYYLTV